MAALYLKVLGGLCSRLRAVVGAVAYCEATGKRLEVDWPQKERSELLGEFPAKLGHLWRGDFGEPLEIIGPCPDYQPDAVVPAVEGDVRVRTCYIEPWLPYVRRPLRAYLDRLTPTAAVQAELRSIARQLRRPAVGLVVRHWDNQPRTAGLDWFASRLAALLGGRAVGSVFLLTDHRAASEAVRAVCGDRLVEQAAPVVGPPRQLDERLLAKKSGGTKDPAGMYAYTRERIVQAAAALYVLADHCDWVVGSNNSSYSEMVAWMRGARHANRGCERPGGIAGGRYEDAWNPPDEEELERCLTPSPS